jgi:hypothetical protein
MRPAALRGAKAAYKARIRAWLDDYRREAGCVDCGTREGRLDFDHRPGEIKVCNPSHASSLVLAQAEAAKCEVRCAPCHARRHGRERGGLNVGSTAA